MKSKTLHYIVTFFGIAMIVLVAIALTARVN